VVGELVHEEVAAGRERLPHLLDRLVGVF
jgi:hypothetical protein